MRKHHTTSISEEALLGQPSTNCPHPIIPSHLKWDQALFP